MKIRLNIPQTLKDILRLRGVPVGLLNSKFAFDTSNDFFDIEVTTDKGDHVISKKEQAVNFIELLETTPDKPKIYVFMSRHYYMKARAMALAAFGRYVESKNGHQWVMANGQFNTPEIKSGLLVLDSISDDMSNYKRDKVHDICQEHCGKPIFILYHGKSPYEICIDSLGVRPSMIFNLDRTVKKSEKAKRL